MNNTGLRAAALWVFAVFCSAFLRYALVSLWHVWTPDGRLAVSPMWFTVINTVHLAATGAVFFVLMYPKHKETP